MNQERMLHKMKVLLILAVSFWGFMSALQNIINWEGTLSAVNATTSMKTFEPNISKFQATSNPIIVWCGALFIIISKLATGFLCLIGAVKMWQALKTDHISFQLAKQIALTGCAISMFMLFTGFIVIAEGWFELWRSDSLREPVLESAFRYGGMIALIAIFVASPEH